MLKTVTCFLPGLSFGALRAQKYPVNLDAQPKGFQNRSDPLAVCRRGSIRNPFSWLQVAKRIENVQKTGFCDKLLGLVMAQRQVVLIGSSVFMAGIEATLGYQPDMRVVRIDATPSRAMEYLAVLRPEVIVFEMTSTQSEFPLTWLNGHPTLRLIGLDATTNAVVVLSGHWLTGLTANGLAEIILEQAK